MSDLLLGSPYKLLRNGHQIQRNITNKHFNNICKYNRCERAKLRELKWMKSRAFENCSTKPKAVISHFRVISLMTFPERVIQNTKQNVLSGTGPLKLKKNNFFIDMKTEAIAGLFREVTNSAQFLFSFCYRTKRVLKTHNSSNRVSHNLSVTSVVLFFYS